MNLAVFDVDGTLTSTSSVDGACFERALRVALGSRASPPTGRSTSMQPIPGSPRRPGWAVAVATGCWRESALLKLRLAGFPLDGPHRPKSSWAQAGPWEEPPDALGGGPPGLVPPLPLYRGRTVTFKPDGKAFLVATDRWLNTYSWDGKNAIPQSSQLLHGFWKRGFRFPQDCESCIQVALGGADNSLHLETLHLDEPIDPPIEGEPRKLLAMWQARLGLTFDEQMKPVPR